ncbi:MAG: FkbM family methyltransferase [Chloroflexi bacterium]|nr:FkbM family methyltransferase [Chloroflexota bacterium]
MTVTRNPLVLLTLKETLKRTGARKSVTFRNGQTYSLTWPQFRIFRDNYVYLSKYQIIQVEADQFKIVDKRSEVQSTSEQLPLLLDLMEDFALNQEEGVYHLKSEKLELTGSLAMLACMRELRTGEYEYDYKDKVVLDVGGFEGESAVYFWQRGAKKVIIYEPVPAHVEVIKRNVALNHIQAEIHQSGIGTKDGTQIIEYEKTDPGFGMLNSGSKRLEIQISEVSKVIQESGADIAKFDCEGGEQSLVDVPAQILRKISYYIVEVHSPQISLSVREKFSGAGFILEKETAKPPTRFSVLAFKRADQFSN